MNRIPPVVQSLAAAEGWRNPPSHRIGRRPWVLLVGLLLGLFAVAGRASAQGAMTNGENHAGAVSLPGETDTWTFPASAGEHITVTVAEVGADSPFVPYVRLINPSGVLVAQDWGARAGGVSTIAVTGTYTVEVRSNDAGGDDTGNYILRLAKAPGAFVVPTGDEGGTITNGGNHAGAIARGDLDLWSFAASAGEHISVTLAEVGADTAFVPYLALISPSGTLVAQDWGARAGGVSTIAVTGTYTVIVRSHDPEMDEGGSYVVRLAKAPGVFVVPTGDEGGTITNGGNHTGTIARGDLDMWSFPANAGDHLTITLAEVGADTAFVPYLALISPSGTLVAHNWGPLVGRVSTTAATGTYTVIVRSHDPETDDGGNYVVRLAKAPGAFVVPSGDEGGALTNTNRSGVIDRGDIDQWACTTTAAGVLVTFSISETGGDSAFVPYIGLVGPTGTLLAHNWGPTSATINVNVPAAGEYRLKVFSNDAGGDAGGSYLLSVPTNCGVAPPPPTRQDTAIDFGQYGVWMRYNHGGPNERWQQLDPRDPRAMATGDLDGDGHSDLIVSFPGAGVRVWMNDSQWIQLHPFDATEIVTGDLDADDNDDVVLSFPGYGLYVWYNNTSWTHLHPLTSAGLATGNLDNDADGRDDLIVNFTGYGVYRYMNNSSWLQLHPLNASDITTGDLDGSGRDEVILSFAGHGVWAHFNNTTWTQLHVLESRGIAVGNLDGDPGNRDDVTITFAGYGAWSWMNNASWVNRHPFDSRPMVVGDLDASGRGDLLMSFSGYGIWIWWNNTNFTQLHPVNPDMFTTGRFDDE